MSSFKVEVVRIGEVRRHDNADTLSITQVFNYPVIFRTGEYAVGDLAAYVPVEAVVAEAPQWEFLAGHRRIRAKRLRGVFSMGLLTPAPAGASEGDDVAAALGITKYDPPVPMQMGGECENDPGFIPRYTDIENFLRYGSKIAPGTEVVITEKIHGANARFVHDGQRLWVGSHGQIKAPSESNMWWRAARNCDLETKLARAPRMVFYGEVFGAVQDLKYGAKNGELFVRFFDVLDSTNRTYLDWDKTAALLTDLELAAAPLLYRGVLPVMAELRGLTETTSALAENMREGIVIRPVVEQWDDEVGRVILKLIAEQYLLRKGGSEAK